MNRQILRKGLMGVLALVLLVSGGYAWKTAQDFHEEVTIYETTQETFVTVIEEEVPLAQLPTMELTALPDMEGEPVAQAVEPVIPEETVEPVDPFDPGIAVDFEALTGYNEDVVGWIYIPDTAISYPVLQGADNWEYLNTAYDGTYAYGGSIFMDYRIPGDFAQANTIIYGHNVNSGTMFSDLMNYRNQDYGTAHPAFFLLTPEGNLRYEICYVLVTSATSPVYDFDFTEENTFASHLAYLENHALYSTGLIVEEDATLVTLSTCTNASQEERLVVIGKWIAP